MSLSVYESVLLTHVNEQYSGEMYTTPATHIMTLFQNN